MTLTGFIWYCEMAGLIAVAMNCFVRRYWLAFALSAFAASLANLFQELVANNFVIRPSDMAFWLPMLLIEGVVLALPMVAIVGIPFYLIRRRIRRGSCQPPKICG